MTEIHVPGAVLYAEADGNPAAPALLLVHAGIAHLRMWDSIVPQLAETHFVMRYDTRGWGKTTQQNTEFSNRADLIAVLDHFGIEQATLIGCSRGGVIALDTALEFPDRVKGLVAIGSALMGSEFPEPTEREAELFDEIEAAEEAGDWEKALRLEVELWSIGPLRSAADLDPTFVETAYQLNLDNLVRAGEEASPIPLQPAAFERVSSLSIPVLVTVGDYDLSESIAQYQTQLDHIPGSVGAILSGTAHLPSVENPEQFMSVLTPWLEQHGL